MRIAHDRGMIFNEFDETTQEDSLQQYYAEVDVISSHIGDEEMLSLVLDYQESGCLEKRDQVFESVAKLVVYIAKQYVPRNYHLLSDLTQEGNLGVFEALDAFDPNKNTKFSYYATWWIKAKILVYLQKNNYLINPVTTQKNIHLFWATTREEFPDMEFYESLSVKHKVSVEKVRGMVELIKPMLPIQDYENDTRVSYCDSYREDDNVVVEALANYRDSLKWINDREMFILVNVLFSHTKTLQELANDFKVSKERIRQIQERLLTTLKDFCQSYFDVEIDFLTWKRILLRRG